jgi:T5orf172 domain
MAKLSNEQKQFLKNFGIPIEKAIDGNDFSKSDCMALMKDFDYEIAYGVSPCQKEGHTLRWRSWSCAQCNTHHRIFQERHRSYGYVYYAYSEKAQLTKVGYCENMTERRKTLNTRKTGSFHDWIMPTALYCEENAGLIESLVHKELKVYRVSNSEYRDVSGQVSKELYKISPEIAWTTIQRIGKENGYEP